jgi:hypothetical protein
MMCLVDKQHKYATLYVFGTELSGLSPYAGQVCLQVLQDY